MKWNNVQFSELGELKGKVDCVRLMRREGGMNATMDEKLSKAVLLFLGLVDPPKWPVARPDREWVNWDDAHGGDAARAVDWFRWEWVSLCDQVCLYARVGELDWLRWLIGHPLADAWLETVESDCGQWVAVICDAETLLRAWELRRAEVAGDEFCSRVLRLAYRKKVDMFEDMTWLDAGR